MSKDKGNYHTYALRQYTAKDRFLGLVGNLNKKQILV